MMTGVSQAGLQGQGIQAPKYFNSEVMSDVDVVFREPISCEDSAAIPAHAFLLGTHSPVLQAMLLGQFCEGCETSGGHKRRLVLEGDSSTRDAFLVFLKILYGVAEVPGEEDLEKPLPLQALMEMASKYDTRVVQDWIGGCLDALLSSDEAATAVKVFFAARRLQLDSVAESALRWLRRHSIRLFSGAPCPLAASAESLEQLQDLLSPELAVSCSAEPLSVLVAICQWACLHPDRPVEEVVSVVTKLVDMALVVPSTHLLHCLGVLKEKSPELYAAVLSEVISAQLDPSKCRMLSCTVRASWRIAVPKFGEVLMSPVIGVGTLATCQLCMDFSGNRPFFASLLVEWRSPAEAGCAPLNLNCSVTLGREAQQAPEALGGAQFQQPLQQGQQQQGPGTPSRQQPPATPRKAYKITQPYSPSSLRREKPLSGVQRPDARAGKFMTASITITL